MKFKGSRTALGLGSAACYGDQTMGLNKMKVIFFSHNKNSRATKSMAVYWCYNIIHNLGPLVFSTIFSVNYCS